MSPKRFYFVMLGAVGLLSVLAVASMVLGNTLLSKKAERLTELKLENRVLDEQQLSIVRAQKDIDQYAELERIAKQIVPQEKDQAKTVRELVKFAQESGLQLGSITFPSSTLGQAQAKPAAGSEGSTSTTAPKAPPVTQVKPAEGITGVYQLEVTLQSIPRTATFPKLVSFLQKLESNRRTAQVSNITITPDNENRNLLTFSIVVNVYIKP